MRQNRFIAFERRHLKGWGISLLISLCMTYVFFVITTPKEKDQKQRTVIPPYHAELKYSLHLISPAQLGINQWQIGDYAQYEYRKPVYKPPSSDISEAYPEKTTHLSSTTVAFHIIEKLTTSQIRRYWLKITGLLSFRDVPGDIYQLGYPNDIRPTMENRRYGFLQNYVPSKFSHHNLDDIPLAKLVKLGHDEIETQAGRFKCIRYRVDIGTNFPPQEIWVNTKVRPLGIVRMQSQNEILELISFGQNTDVPVPKLFQPVIQGISILDRGCTSCHGSNNCHESIFPPK